MTSVASAIANPFVGAKPLSIGRKLYGRDWETRMLHGMLLSKRLVLLHSPSGAGKTSLIQAGLWPLLESRFRLRPPIRVNALPGATSAVRNRYLYSTFSSLDATSALKDDGTRRLRDFRFDGDASKPELWIFDQFEEVVSLDPIDDTARREFFEELGEALGDEDNPRWALFAMREDYLGALQPFFKLLPTGLSAHFRLDLLDRGNARLAIDGLARDGAGSFESGAAETLIADLRKIQFQFPDGRVEPRDGPFVEPVLLQIVCRRLWERAAGRGTPVSVTAADVATPAQSGGPDAPHVPAGFVDEALSAYYAEQVSALAGGEPARERRMRDWFERQLIVDRKLRSQVMRGQKEQRAFVDDETVQKLAQSWLLREEPRGGRNWLELSHDRLIKPILFDNGNWREANLSLFQKSFEAWRSGDRAPSLLLRGYRLVQAEAWVREHSAEILQEEHEYLDRCQEARTRADRERGGRDLTQTGWGVVFPTGCDPRIPAALSEMLNYREDMAGKLYKILEYQPGDSAEQFLARYQASSGQLDPEKVPYYLLLVGGPEQMPFEFQYGLDLTYAVGRLAFDDPTDYARYARSLVTAETDQVALQRTVGVFSPLPPEDRASALLHTTIVDPLVERLSRDVPEWRQTLALREQASKARLGQMLGGPDTPALLFACAHGMGFPEGDPQQRDYQGALVCQDWPGPMGHSAKDGKRLSPEFYFSGDDLGADARLLGLVAFIFGEYSAGTPEMEDYQTQWTSRARNRLAAQPFIARLAQRLLAHPAGGALAIVAHVERGWIIPTLSPTGSMFAVLRRLMSGHTVGSAMEAMNQRYSLLAVSLADTMRPLIFGGMTRSRDVETQLDNLQIASVDARNYIILGDPAARIPIDEQVAQAVRPAIRPVDTLAATPPVTAPPPAAAAAEAVLTLDIELRRQPGDPADAAPLGYAAGVRWQYPGTSASVELSTGTFDLARLRELSADAEAYGRQLGECLFGPQEPDAGMPDTTQQISAGPGRTGARALYAAFLQARGLALALKLPLQLQLILDPQLPELLDLHWELLRDPVDGTPLFVGESTVFSRRLASPSPAVPRVSQNLRTLLAVAGSHNTPGGRAQELEQARLAPGTLPYGELQRVTLAALQAELGRQYGVLYLVAEPAAGGAGVVLDDEAGGQRPATEQELAGALAGSQSPPPLVILLSPADRPGQFSSALVQALFSAGVAAVITAQAGNAMLACMTALFEALQRDGAIDRAMAHARTTLALQGSTGSPVLYMSSRSGRLFQPAGPLSAIISAPVPKDYVPRPQLQGALSAALLAPQAPLVALSGMSGSGKSALARAAYNDPAVQASFPQVRLWATLGPKPQLADGLRAWISALGGDGSGSTQPAELKALLSDLLRDRRALLVIDDACSPADLEAYLVQRPGCVYLVTTHDRSVLPPAAAVIEVGPLGQLEALQVLASGLDPEIPGLQSSLEPLAARLGRLPLALQLANALLRERVMSRRQKLSDAVDYMLASVDQYGPAVFDPTGSGFGVAQALESSLQALSPEDRQRLAELSIFVEGAQVPLALIAALWQPTEGMQAQEASLLVRRLEQYSLVEIAWGPDHAPAAARMVPIVRAYLARSVTASVQDLNARLLDSAVPALHDAPHGVKLEEITAGLDEYMRQYLVRHLIDAGRNEALGDALFANGLDGVTHAPLTSPVAPGELTARVFAAFRRLAPQDRDEIQDFLNRQTRGFSSGPETNVARPEEAGWAVVLPEGADPGIREALEPLIRHREEQTGRKPAMLAFRPGEDKTHFLARNGVSPGVANWDRVPYYLLIAAGPRDLPFELQAGLNRHYATGRLHFGSTDAYAAYARNVVEYEVSGPLSRDHELLVWAPESALDRETSLSSNFLALPLFSQFSAQGFGKRMLRAGEATKASLQSALAGLRPPAIIFTAGHGLGYQGPYPDVSTRQGALADQSGDALRAEDLGSDTNVRGLMHFAFASYGAGTSYDWPWDARHPYDFEKAERGETSFVAALPARLLELGALAFIGFYSRVWSYPFLTDSGVVSADSVMFEPYMRMLRQLADGLPAGHALHNLHENALLLAASLKDDAERASYAKVPPASEESAARRWTAWRNTSTAVLLGDPAVRVWRPQA